jgi:two-component sensor histidine kinase
VLFLNVTLFLYFIKIDLLKFTIIFFFCVFFGFSISVEAQEYDDLYIQLENLLLVDKTDKVIRIVDSLTLDNSISKKQLNDFKALKVAALVEIYLLPEALKLADKILTDAPEISEKTLVRLHLEKGLILEINHQQKEVALEFDIIEKIYETRPKDRLYGEYLFRKASYYRVFKSIKNRKNLAMLYINEAIDFGDANKFYGVSGRAKMIQSFLLEKKEENKDEITRLLKSALNDFLLLKNERNICMMYKNLATHFLFFNDLEPTNKYLDSALYVAKKRNDFLNLKWLYQGKHKVFEKKNQLDSALFYFKKYHNNEMILNEIKQGREISLINFENQIEKEKQLAQNTQIKLTETKKTNKFLYLFIIGVVFLSSIIIFLYSRLRKRKQKIDTQNELLQKSVVEKELLLKELNHRVKNNLSLIISLIKFQSQEINEEFYKEKFKHLENRISTIAIAHEQFIYSENKIDGKFYNLEEYLQKISDSLINVSTRNIKYSQHIDFLKLNIDTALPIGILINELVSNSIEHAITKDTLEIHIRIEIINNYVSISYNDSGTVFNTADKTDSLGLFIINSMVSQLNGKIERKASSYLIHLEQKL